MRNRGIVILAAAAVLVPANVDGQRDRQGNRNDRQNRQDERWEDTRGPGYDNDRYLDEGRYDYDDGYRYDDRYERPSDRYRGPYSRRNPRSSDWRYQNWGDFHLYAPRGLRTRHMGERGIRQLLGAQGLRRLKRIARQSGTRGPLTATWTASRRYGDRLMVRSRGRRIAEIHDFNRDGYVDEVLVRRPRARVRW